MRQQLPQILERFRVLQLTGGSEAASEMLENFILDLQDLSKDLAQASAKRNRLRVKKILADARERCYNMGADQLTNLCTQMQIHVERGELLSLAPMVEEFGGLVQSLLSEVLNSQQTRSA